VWLCLYIPFHLRKYYKFYVKGYVSSDLSEVNDNEYSDIYFFVQSEGWKDIYKSYHVSIYTNFSLSFEEELGIDSTGNIYVESDDLGVSTSISPGTSRPIYHGVCLWYHGRGDYTYTERDTYFEIRIDDFKAYFDWPQDPSINFGSEESIIAISSPENNKAIGEQHRVKASVPTTVTWVAFYYKPENETSWIFLYNDTTAEDGFYYDWNTTDLDEGWYEIYGETDQGPTQTVKFFIDHTPPEPKIYDPKPLWYYSVKVPIQVSGVDNFDIGTCYYAIDNKNYTEIDCGDLIYIWVDPGVHTAYFKVCDTVDHCVEEANQFMASQGFGGIAIRRPAPAPAARVVPPITIEKIIERRIEPYRRATIISGTISAISLLYLILSLIGLI